MTNEGTTTQELVPEGGLKKRKPNSGSAANAARLWEMARLTLMHELIRF